MIVFYLDGYKCRMDFFAFLRGLSRLSSVKIVFCQDCALSRMSSVKIVLCQDCALSRLFSVKIVLCQE